MTFLVQENPSVFPFTSCIFTREREFKENEISVSKKLMTKNYFMACVAKKGKKKQLNILWLNFKIPISVTKNTVGF